MNKIEAMYERPRVKVKGSRATLHTLPQSLFYFSAEMLRAFTQPTFHELLFFFSKVRLPSGTVVKIKRYYWGNNVEVQAPKSDKTKTEGMCGNFDGDPNNEFEFGGPDGDQKTADQNSFGESWR